ncbi:hypothetical protein [Sphingomonas alpina]|uniref:Uncharacterized protein n=1 Tax=Sphingomonas alpina TaxID=653931 RepID=A0A7H0LG17_9SPHN|nr:hypothetical protein [Sphingomonas alpina]QNQ08620.1 hypothetical protein H3Z74_17995 [Sphingomonas alpina]
MIKSALALAAFAVLVLFGLFWWSGDRPQPSEDEIVVVPTAATPEALLSAPSSPGAEGDAAALALVEKQILEVIGEPGTSLRDVRIVDQERQIACGQRTSQGSAALRRFVWLSQVRQVVTDDGGQDFAILVHVCNPPPPPQN